MPARAGERAPLTVLVLVATLAAGGCAGEISEQTETTTLASSAHPSPFRLFAPTSIWNRQVIRDTALDPGSAVLIAHLSEQIETERARGGGPGINTTSYSVPVYTAPADSPSVRVKLVSPRAERALQAALSAVPLPPEAQPAAGSDKHLVVWQPSRDRLWEFWRLERVNGSWQTEWAGAIRHVSRSSGVFGRESWPRANRSWGASASSLSIAGGLITPEDLRAGVINHALAMGSPDIRTSVVAAPAGRTDGASADPLSLPEGAHLRLNPALRLTSLHLPPLTMMIATAAQRYGIVVRDRASHLTFYAEDPTPTGTNPYTQPGGFFAGLTPEALLASFPFKSLQILPMRLRRVRASGPGG